MVLPKFNLYLMLIAFLLNWLWEILQMPLFGVKEETTWAKGLFFCTLATLIDVLTTWAVFVAARFLAKNLDWKFYAGAALLGAICGVAFERFAFAFGLWRYGALMPVVPFIETGLSPFLQLAISIPFSIWLAQRLSQREATEK